MAFKHSNSGIIVLLALGAIVLAEKFWSGPPFGHPACAGQFYNQQLPTVDATHSKSTQQLCYEQFALLYSGLTKTPLWSAEHLTPARVTATQDIHRKNAFHAEPRLSRNTGSELSDYANSGYDRGHMSPSGDMPTEQSQHESFSLANMVPQAPCNNEVIWAKIENSVRTMAEHGDIYVVTGPVFDADQPTQQIGNGVIVPSRIFKAVLDPDSMAAGVYITPNAAGNAWKTISLNELRALTGIDAFPGVAEDVKANPIEMPAPRGGGHGCRVHATASSR